MSSSGEASSSQDSVETLRELFQENLQRYAKTVKTTVHDDRPLSPRNSLVLSSEQQQRESTREESRAQVQEWVQWWKELWEMIQEHKSIDFLLDGISSAGKAVCKLEAAKTLFPAARGKINPSFTPEDCQEGEGHYLLDILRSFPSAEDVFSLFMQRSVPTEWLWWLWEEEESKPTAWRYLRRHLDPDFAEKEENIAHNPLYRVISHMLPDATVTNADIRAQYSEQEWSDVEEAYGPYDRDVPSLAFRLKMQQVGHFFMTLCEMDLVIIPVETWFALRRKIVVPDLVIELFADCILQGDVDVERMGCTLLLLATEDKSVDLMTLLVEDLDANPLVHFDDMPERCPVLRLCQTIGYLLQQCNQYGEEGGEETEALYAQAEGEMYERIHHLMILLGKTFGPYVVHHMLLHKGNYEEWLIHDTQLPAEDVGMWHEIFSTMEAAIGDGDLTRVMLQQICWNSVSHRLQCFEKRKKRMDRKKKEELLNE